MATTDAPSSRHRERIALAILAACVLGIAVIALIVYLGRPPQIGTNDEVFRTVDALYTAVRNRDEKQLGECERRLHDYRAAGKLPPDAADALDAIIQKAKSGSWQTAAERLYEFMLAQKREGAIDPAPDRTEKTSAAGFRKRR